MRITAREVAFEVIFASRFTGDVDRGLFNALAKKEKLTEDDIIYAERVIALAKEHAEEFGKIIDGLSVSFPEPRIFPADISILLIAMAEIKYMDDVPDVVSVNEAANIASKFSSPKSASFISGILSEIIRDKNV